MPVGQKFHERDLVIPVLQWCAAAPGGWMSTADLIKRSIEVFEPEGRDAEILKNRSDARFTQYVRNLVCHRGVKHSMFKRGWAVYINDGIRITEAGCEFLKTIPSHRSRAA
jgi:hypothetical protein